MYPARLILSGSPSLHLGIAEGLAEGTGLVVEELVAKGPRRANCRLRLQVEIGS
jgi:hypothetical protein